MNDIIQADRNRYLRRKTASKYKVHCAVIATAFLVSTVGFIAYQDMAKKYEGMVEYNRVLLRLDTRVYPVSFDLEIEV